MRYRFQLRTLFALVAILGLALAASTLYLRTKAEARAQYDFERYMAAYDAYEMHDEQKLCEAAHKWLVAQKRLPWNNNAEVEREYLKRLRDIEQRAHSRAKITLFGTERALIDAQTRAEQVTRWRREAEAGRK